MKKIMITIGAGIVTAFLTVSCFDLSENVYSEIPVDNFFKTEQDVLTYAGRAYTKLQPYPEEQRLWALATSSSDELVVPGRDDGEWWGQGRWDQLKSHQISPTNNILRNAWDFVYQGISSCNEVLYVVEQSPIEFEGKSRILAEIRILRAFFYYWATDGWGNIPFSVDFTEKDLPKQKDRAFMYEFLVKEIQDNIDALQANPTPAYYGRVTKGMAYTLLSRIYMSAPKWVGQEKWEEANAACDAVIALQAYQIEDDYFSNFKTQNESSKENIFVIVYNSILTNDHFYWWVLTLNTSSRATFDFLGEPWDGFVLPPDFFTKFDSEDQRRKSFLFGQQYDKNGEAIVVNGEPFIYTTTIDNYRARKKWEGARGVKYQYQSGLQYFENDMENDFVLFRYADVLYTKLEALWRLGRAGEFIDDPALQKIRTRAGLAPYTTGDLTEQELLDEFGREFVWEGRRRSDLIRFGKYGATWWNKPASGPNAELFPIPQSVLNTNPNLSPNP